MSDLRQREPRQECPAFLAFVRRKACCVCGAPPRSQAAHVKMGNPAIAKRGAGMAEKPDDRWAVPLCSSCHLDAPDAQHRVGEVAFWARAKLDPFKIAADLWAKFCQKRRPMMEPGVEAEFIVDDANPGVLRAPTPELDPELYCVQIRRKPKRRKNNGGIRPIKRGVGPGLKSKVSRPILSRGFPKGLKRKIPSRPFNREK